MSSELTVVVMTYNLWASNLWDQREPVLRRFFAIREPDIVAVQELRPESRRLLDEALPRHVRVDDEFEGWLRESNIWWRSDLFELDDYGATDIRLRSRLRRLFWVRLRPLSAGGGRPWLVATAHLTWPGNSDEEATGVNPRLGESERAADALERCSAGGPCLFMGDLNEDRHPARILRAAGFQDCFTALGQSSPITSPVTPLIRPEGDDVAPLGVPKVIDYQFHRGPIRVRTAEVPEFFYDTVAPSDHKPVVATYTAYAEWGGDVLPLTVL